MPALRHLEQALSHPERRLLDGLETPFGISGFLDGLTYSPDPFYRCPLRVLRDGLAHCFDGAVFAAMALARQGHSPLLLDMLPNHRDDDHVLALFRANGRWGAIAKSNFVGLRFREPVYRTLRELVMSYFEHFYNVEGEKTLRGYTVTLPLQRFDHLDWMTDDGPMETIAGGLDRLRRFDLLTDAMVEGLSPMDARAYRAGMLGVNQAGLWRPEGKS